MNAVEARSAEKRRLILDAARKAFSLHGFHAASMAEIASGAGISVGHIYRYFENKEAVIIAIVEADLEDAAVEIADMQHDPAAIADHIVSHVIGERQKDRSMMLEILAEAGRNPRVAAKVRAADTELRARLYDAFKVRLPRAGDDLDERVEVVCTLVEGLIVRSLKTADGDRTAVSRRVRDLLVEAISG